MENYLFKSNKAINGDDLNDKGNDYYKKIMEKKRKIKAYDIPKKVFFSDDEDDNQSISKYNKYNNQRRIRTNSMHNKYNQNSILIYKEQLHKKSTIEQTPNKKTERKNIIKEDKISKNLQKSKISKKVTFQTNNFITYIDIESYKKYNGENSQIEPYSEDKIKAKSKCCLIY